MSRQSTAAEHHLWGAAAAAVAVSMLLDTLGASLGVHVRTHRLLLLFPKGCSGKCTGVPSVSRSFAEDATSCSLRCLEAVEDPRGLLFFKI